MLQQLYCWLFQVVGLFALSWQCWHAVVTGSRVDWDSTVISAWTAKWDHRLPVVQDQS